MISLSGLETHSQGVASKTEASIHSRIATADDKCPMCDIAGESLQHCFISCPHSLQVWTIAGFPPHP